MSVLSLEELISHLQQLPLEHHLCGHCQGLHLDHLEERPEVLEARVFCFAEHLQFLVEVEIKPSAILQFQAVSCQLNQELPQSKLFMELDDDIMPRVVCSLSLPNFNLDQAQIRHWLSLCEQQCGQLIERLLTMNMVLDQEMFDEFDINATPDAFH